MNHRVPSAIEQDNRERLRAFDAAVEHRARCSDSLAT